MAKETIPDIVIGRLPTYLQALSHLTAEDKEITSSQELGDRLGISPAQTAKTCPISASSASRAQATPSRSYAINCVRFCKLIKHGM